jgi:hypothetical protein
MAQDLHHCNAAGLRRGVDMDKATTVSQRGDTQKIAMDQWNPFLAAFTRENRGAHARLDVVGTDVGYQVETEDRPFDGIAADIKDRERSVWISFGSTPDNHLTHGVHSVTAIWVTRPTDEAGPAVGIDAQDGTTTVLELSKPEEYALPPAAPPAGKA